MLAFWCRDDETPGGETIIVPVRRVYIVINNTYLTRVSDGAPIPVHSMSLSLDAGSWTWGFDATLPALNGKDGIKTVRFKVSHMAVLPDFATWRATRAGQGFDARTFEVRARPVAPIDGARPSMTVLVQ